MFNQDILRLELSTTPIRCADDVRVWIYMHRSDCNSVVFFVVVLVVILSNLCLNRSLCVCVDWHNTCWMNLHVYIRGCVCVCASKGVRLHDKQVFRGKNITVCHVCVYVNMCVGSACAEFLVFDMSHNIH